MGFVAALLLSAATWFGFQTPSHNIVCNGDAASLSCVVFSASPTCQHTWTLRAEGRPTYRCRYANIGTEVPVLAFGHTVTKHGMRCVSRRTGLTCTNSSGHGFALSREHQRVF